MLFQFGEVFNSNLIRVLISKVYFINSLFDNSDFHLEVQIVMILSSRSS